jgi:hypothetical protein
MKPRLLFLVALFVVGGCASARQAPPRPADITSTVISGGATIQLTSQVRVENTRVPRPAARVWPALLDVYQEFDLPIETLESDSLIVGSDRWQISGQVGTEPLSRFVRCGGTAGIVEVSDRFRVEITLFSAVVVTDRTNSLLQTSMTATARDPFSNTAPRQCISTGELERRIARGVHERMNVTAQELADRPGPRLGEPQIVPRGPDGPITEAARPVVQPAPAGVLAASGAAGGALGVYLGSLIDADCTRHCLNAKGTLWPLVAGTTMMPLSVHLANGRRGSFLRSFLISSGWAFVGMVAAGASDDPRVLWAIAPGQLISTVLMERSTTRAGSEDGLRD